MSNLSFKVTIEFICKGMIDKECFDERYNSDPMLAYKFISDDFKDSVFNFCEDNGNIIKVELAKKK